MSGRLAARPAGRRSSPGRRRGSPSSSSIRSSWLYFAVAVGARRRAGLDLARAERDREVGDRRVLGLARPVGHDRRVAARLREPDRLERLGQRPDLVHLDEDRVADAALDALAQPLGVGDEEVVADELDAVAELGASAAPTRPSRPRRGRPRSRRSGSARRARPRSRASRRSTSPGPRSGRRRRRRARSSAGSSAIATALAVAGALGRLEDRLDRRLARLEVGREAALVADARREPALARAPASARGRPRRRCRSPSREASARRPARP